VLTGHDGRVRAAAVSADGHTAVSGDGTVRVWDLAGTAAPRVVTGAAEPRSGWNANWRPGPRSPKPPGWPDHMSRPPWWTSAVELVERMLRSVAHVEEDLGGGAVEDRWLRETAVRLAVSLDPAGSNAKDFAAAARGYVAQIVWPDAVVPRTDLGNIFKAPSPSEWLPRSQDQNRDARR
jgi:hypothetical protein